MKDPHQKNLRKGRLSVPFGLYFVTKCTAEDTLLGEQQRTDVVNALFRSREQGTILLHGFVVMPNHWHVLFSIVGDGTLADVVTAICRFARYSWRDVGNGGYQWQKGYYDHKLRQGESVVDMVRYMEANPVRRGLVSVATAWPWSSAWPMFDGKLDRSFLGLERWVERRR